METIINILANIAIIIASAYVVAVLIIFICAVLGGIADENENLH
ncbi:hypothetical protein [Xanthomarina gelatinilytica]